MNKDWILFHFREAHEELTRTIPDIESRSDYSEVEFEIAMQHLYNHLNTAWNSRNAPDPTRPKDFYRWRAFPKDMRMDQ